TVSEPRVQRICRPAWALLQGATADISIVLFFFQAEDGIRVFHVTGVQTCALRSCIPSERRGPGVRSARRLLLREAEGVGDALERSEERRGGRECRSRWTKSHYHKNGGQVDQHRWCRLVRWTDATPA